MLWGSHVWLVICGYLTSFFLWQCLNFKLSQLRTYVFDESQIIDSIKWSDKNSRVTGLLYILWHSQRERERNGGGEAEARRRRRRRRRRGNTEGGAEAEQRVEFKGDRLCGEGDGEVHVPEQQPFFSASPLSLRYIHSRFWRDPSHHQSPRQRPPSCEYYCTVCTLYFNLPSWTFYYCLGFWSSNASVGNDIECNMSYRNA